MTKKLQIVRVDNDLVQKANLQIGNNLIGRGAATGCNDGQVLKHAVTINVSPNDEMTITAVAPCYMKSTGCAQWRALKLGTSVPIKPGDVCSLLPEKCWFKIISESNTMDKNEQKSKRKTDEELNTEIDNKKVCLSSNIETMLASPSETLNDILNNKDSASKQDLPINGDTEHNNTHTPILQEIYAASSPEGDNMPATCSNISTNSQNVIESSVTCKSNRKRKAEVIKSTKETAIVETQKKIKWDCSAHFSDQNEVPSPHTKDKSQLATTAKLQNQTNVLNAKKVSREKCMYGSRCYRKNPNHKKNCSHPGDSDYDVVDNRQECMYGVKCYRKNPQHKAQFKHTTVPRRRRRAATPVRPITKTFESDSSSMEESVDESDYEPSSVYSDSSEKSDWDDSESEWEDDTTG